MNKLNIHSYIKDVILTKSCRTHFKDEFLDKEKGKVKNCNEAPDYKMQIKDNFPFLSERCYKLICKKLDEAYAESVENNFMGYYVSYANYVYNKLNTLTLFIESQGESQVCDIIYNYKVMCHANDFINLTYKDCDLGQLPYLGDYTKESSEIQKQNAAKSKKLANVLNAISFILIALICVLSVFTKVTPSISIIGIALSMIFLFIGDKVLCSEQTKGRYEEPKKEKEISNDLNVIASRKKESKILSDEEFVEIIFGLDSISYYLLDCTLYLISTKLKDDSYEEFREFVLSNTVDKDILETVKSLRNDYNSKLESFKKRISAVPKLQAVTANSSYVEKTSSKAYKKIKINLIIAALINALTVCAILLL